MENFDLLMVRRDLEDIPDHTLPRGFHFRFFLDGDEETWADIESQVGEFNSKAQALRHFEKEFGNNIETMKKRCIFIVDKEGVPFGTVTAWHGDIRNRLEGRIHWVGIIPEYQGEGFAKPLITKALNVLDKYHTSAFIKTQSSSHKAVNLYLDFGFEPYIESKDDREAWKQMEKILDRKILDMDRKLLD